MLAKSIDINNVFKLKIGSRAKYHLHTFSDTRPHLESFGKRCSYKVPKTSTNIKLVTTVDRNGTETKRVQCEYCPKTHINVPVYNLHVNTGIVTVVKCSLT